MMEGKNALAGLTREQVELAAKVGLEFAKRHTCGDLQEAVATMDDMERDWKAVEELVGVEGDPETLIQQLRTLMPAPDDATPQFRWNRLRGQITAQIDAIDKATPFEEVEPGWWLRMQRVRKLAQEG